MLDFAVDSNHSAPQFSEEKGMDADDHPGGDNGKEKNIWDWQEEEFTLQRCSENELSQFTWDAVNPDGPDFFSVLEEQTPIKDCTDFEYQEPSVKGNKNDDIDTYSASQLKRRRMLQFTPDCSGLYASDEKNSIFVTSEVKNCSAMEKGIAESLEWNTQWTLGFSDAQCAMDFNELDRLSDGWLVDCLNENEMHPSPNEMYNNVAFNQQADISECYDDQTRMEIEPITESPAASPCRMVTGSKSYTKSARNLTTSVAYPFALIKPCGVQGVLTLDEINQRIHGANAAKIMHKNDEGPSTSRPASALSGKPVVIKTKIRTEGGHGSITITRTKG